MQNKLYTSLEVQAAFTAWATLSPHLFGSEESWCRARRELWLTYTDSRDNKPRGHSRAKEDAIVEEPQLRLV